MAPPNADAAAVVAAPAPKHGTPRRQANKQRRISSTTEGLQRAMSDLALELAASRDRNQSSVADAAATTTTTNNNQIKQQQQLVTTITEPQPQQQVVVVQDARCECCGMQQECTPEYARRVRDRYCGRWVCGLCAEAVNGEAETTSTGTEEALAAHMAVCGRFNRVGRANPVLMQTQAMREILRKRSKSSNSPRNHGGPAAATGGRGLLARSTSCIPAITNKASNL